MLPEPHRCLLEQEPAVLVELCSLLGLELPDGAPLIDAANHAVREMSGRIASGSLDEIVSALPEITQVVRCVERMIEQREPADLLVRLRTSSDAELATELRDEISGLVEGVATFECVRVAPGHGLAEIRAPLDDVCGLIGHCRSTPGWSMGHAHVCDVLRVDRPTDARVSVLDPHEAVYPDLIESVRVYGKLGLLVDGPDAETRLARELYGAERLPLWWLGAESVEDALRILITLSDVLDGALNVELRAAFVVVERHLPITAGAGEEPWDQSSSILARAFGHYLQRVEQNGLVEVQRLTSRPYSFRMGRPTARVRRRTTESAATLRRRLSEPLRGSLQRYGPERNDPGWWGPVDHCARMLLRPRRVSSVVLLVGEDFSCPEIPGRPGLPAWDRLVGDASLPDEYREQGRIETLQSQGPAAIRRVQAAQMMYEHSIPYKAWLAARLPWTWILSFDTDSFIERAAGELIRYRTSATRAWEQARRDQALRLASAGDPSPLHELDETALFKPNRRLLSVEDDGRTEDDAVGRAFDLLEPESGELLIVMLGWSPAITSRKHALNDALVRLLDRDVPENRIDITWIHTSRESETNLDQERYDQLRRILNASARRGRGGGACRHRFIEFRGGQGALEFLYDVTLRFGELEDQSIARRAFLKWQDHDPESIRRDLETVGLGALDPHGPVAPFALRLQDRVNLDEASRLVGLLGDNITLPTAPPRRIRPSQDFGADLRQLVDDCLHNEHEITEISARLGVRNNIPWGRSLAELRHALIDAVNATGSCEQLLDELHRLRRHMEAQILALRRRLPPGRRP